MLDYVIHLLMTFFRRGNSRDREKIKTQYVRDDFLMIDPYRQFSLSRFVRYDVKHIDDIHVQTDTFLDRENERKGEAIDAPVVHFSFSLSLA